MRRAGLAALALCLAMPAAAETVTGTAMWRERIMLPAGAVFEVTVEDIARADAPAEVLGRTEIAVETGPPIPFEVAVDPARIGPQARPAVRATVRHEGRLLFTTDTVVPVLEDGAPSEVSLLLVGVAAPETGLAGTEWRLTALGGAPLPPEARDPELVFIVEGGETRFAASAGCNRFAGGARIDGPSLAFGPAMSTRMACPPPLDAAETALADALERAARWETDGATLRLLDAEGAVLLEARPAG
jgi:putative lipoprotein